MADKAPKLRAFECSWPPGGDHVTVVNALTRGKARYMFWLHLSDAYDEARIVDIKVRGAGAPRSSQMLEHVAKMRGRPELVAGARVTACGRPGAVADAGSGANFFIVFDDGSSGHVHPGDIKLLEEANV